MSWLASLNDELRSMDQDLYAKEDRGVIRIFRKHFVLDRYWLEDENYLLHPRQNDQHIISLTENWSYKSPKRDWGILPVIFRLKEIDQHNRDQLAEVEKQNEAARASKARAQTGKIQDMVREKHSVYKKAFSGINTALMDKKKPVTQKLHQF